jgi:hypothetical protein
MVVSSTSLEHENIHGQSGDHQVVYPWIRLTLLWLIVLVELTLQMSNHVEEPTVRAKVKIQQRTAAIGNSKGKESI